METDNSLLKKSMWRERPAPAEYWRDENRPFLTVLQEAAGDAPATISAAFFNGLLNRTNETDKTDDTYTEL